MVLSTWVQNEVLKEIFLYLLVNAAQSGGPLKYTHPVPGSPWSSSRSSTAFLSDGERISCSLLQLASGEVWQIPSV